MLHWPLRMLRGFLVAVITSLPLAGPEAGCAAWPGRLQGCLLQIPGNGNREPLRADQNRAGDEPQSNPPTAPP